ncbi:hypothetical protein A2U01_0100522, partial [Trifolium medium]|nr:hypothetical protein [Trifolium medium]
VGTSLGQPEQQAEIVTDEGSDFETAAEEEKSQDKATEEEELSGNGTEDSQSEESNKIIPLNEE